MSGLLHSANFCVRLIHIFACGWLVLLNSSIVFHSKNVLPFLSHHITDGCFVYVWFGGFTWEEF